MTCPKSPILGGKKPREHSFLDPGPPMRPVLGTAGGHTRSRETPGASHSPSRDRRLPFHPLVAGRMLTSSGKEPGRGASLGAQPHCPCPSWELRRPLRRGPALSAVLRRTATWPPCRRCPGHGAGSQGLRRGESAYFYHQSQV